MGVNESNMLTRRHLIKTAGFAAGTALLAGGTAEAKGNAETGRAAGGFRLAHLADIHVQPQLRADEGFRQCISHLHDLNPRPDFILTGGDLVMDVLASDEPRAKQLFDLYTAICRDSDIPVRHCIGNHDVFGWSSKGKIAPDHVSYGKKMVQERLQLDRTSYSFDHKGWHMCVLDDIMPREQQGYIGGVNDEDLDWLARDLAAAGDRPKIVCAHIPIVTALLYAHERPPRQKQISFNAGLVCQNVSDILAVFRKQRVNLVLTGHLHQDEFIRFGGTSFIGQGAVSGAWWKGSHKGCPEGFGVVDVMADGTFAHRYETYGWKSAVKKSKQ